MRICRRCVVLLNFNALDLNDLARSIDFLQTSCLDGFSYWAAVCTMLTGGAVAHQLGSNGRLASGAVLLSAQCRRLQRLAVVCALYPCSCDCD